MADNPETVQKFRDITGVGEDVAKERLKEVQGNLEIAVQNFFAAADGGADQPFMVEDNDDEDDDDIEELPGAKIKPAKTSDARFKTVANLNESSSDSDEGGQAFYAGGSTTSGQQVLGPGRSRSQIVADMFRSVREHGGETVEQEVGGPKKPNTLKFSGTGYRLGQTSNDTEVVTPGQSSAGSGRPQVTITLKMWRQGFSINEGQLMDYKDPNNVQFLKTVSRGIIPDELLEQARGSEVHLNMEDHSNEEYVFTKPKLQAFSGKGNVLGSPTPNTTAAAKPPASSSSTEDKAANEARAREAVPLDSEQPVTSVQIRLADGSRLVASFNHTNTIANLRTFISIARPEYAGVAYRLMTSFPSKDLTDDSASLSSAGLLNAAILQRLS